MGWRKLTVRDGDLARCCAAQGPIICEASLEVCFVRCGSIILSRQTVDNSRRPVGSTQSQAVWSVHAEFDSAAITIAAPGMQDGVF